MPAWSHVGQKMYEMWGLAPDPLPEGSMEERHVRHVMLDLETWGVVPGCAIRSIGAVLFDPYSTDFSGRYYANVDDLSCYDHGLGRDPGTIKWWNAHPEAGAILMSGQRHLKIVLLEFAEWYRVNGGEAIWAHGEAFDLPVLEAAYRAVDVIYPWDHRVGRDTRTLYMLAGFDVRSIPFQGQPHCALDDAMQQVRCVQRATQMISSWRERASHR